MESGAATTDAILARTRGRGVDAVLVTASTKSSDPVMLACERVRDRGTVVVVGDVGVELARTPFYLKEVDLKFARSYGPGRYERSYEEYAVDYPIGHVRWTEGRNIEAFLDLVARGKVVVDDLVTHVFGIDEADKAYATISSDDRALAVQFAYQPDSIEVGPITLGHPQPGSASVGLIGAGNFARMTLVPAMKAAGFEGISAITSSGGLSARHLAERHDIGIVAPDVAGLLAMEQVDTVFVLSRHDSHAELAVQALRAGKHVFVEKPLALDDAELDSGPRRPERLGQAAVDGFQPPTQRGGEARQGGAWEVKGVRWSPTTGSTRVDFQRPTGTRTAARAAGSSARSATSSIWSGGSSEAGPLASAQWAQEWVRDCSRKT